MAFIGYNSKGNRQYFVSVGGFGTYSYTEKPEESLEEFLIRILYSKESENITKDDHSRAKAMQEQIYLGIENMLLEGTEKRTPEELYFEYTQVISLIKESSVLGPIFSRKPFLFFGQSKLELLKQVVEKNILFQNKSLALK